MTIEIAKIKYVGVTISALIGLQLGSAFDR